MAAVLALAAMGAVLLAALAAFTAMRWQARSFDRRETTYLSTIRDLNNRLMFLCEKPWDSPDYIKREIVADEDELDTLQRRGIIRDPENGVPDLAYVGHDQPGLDDLT